LALRPDITAQIGRIATTRMAHKARPLRLGYGGQVARVKGTQLNPDRESLQAGAELIGTDSLLAVREILLLALEALQNLGARGLSVDFTMPGLVRELAQSVWPVAEDQRAALEDALDGKDVGGLNALGFGAYEPLIAAAGPAERALQTLRALKLGKNIDARLTDIAALAKAAAPFAQCTLDPTERHSFAYQSWVGFSIYAHGVRDEVVRGGSYAVVHPDGHTEAAVGFSAYIDPLVDAGLGSVQRPRILLPLGTGTDIGAHLRAQGFVTVAALDATTRPQALDCTHIWDKDKAQPLG